MARTLHLGISGIVFSAAAAGIYRLLLAGPEPVEADISLGFIALQGMQLIGRLLGDRLIDRFGQRLIARLGGLIVMLGMSAALLVPGIASTIIGFGLAGLGVATLIPAAMHAADELPGFKAGAGLTIVSWLMRVGFLVSPPEIGAVADASELRYGLLVMPLGGLLVVLLAGVLTGKQSTH
ncbi:hypothetical protein [Arthrobacter sp. UYP6]|uniref:hypothetical protein n=1 Tax=Arthrobacter sp. UYP6 TaxID=1756378 RepID=UPI003392B311